MKYSKMLLPTAKEVPADATIPSHQLMLRAGLIRKLGSGIYSYLPLGWRCLQKVMTIIREEMNRTGAQEILLPAVQPIELWQRTGRDVDYGETMATFTDRHGRVNVLAPTAEEVVTSIAAGEIKSYKQMPLNLYQISFKFRDEFRPRFGVLRSREFIMKDAYSFHANEKSLDETYKVMYETYCRIFKRLGLEYVIVEAESGEMGGCGSHQFTIPCENGEDVIVQTQDGSYAANIEKAAVDPLPKEKLIKSVPAVEEIYTPKSGTIEAVCDFMKTEPKDMLKTLVYTVDDEVIVGLIRGDHELNPEKLNQIFAGQHVELADEATVVRFSGAAVGFCGPVGLEDTVAKVVIDHAVAAMAVGVAGANKTDYHVENVVPGRDFPLEGAHVIVADIRNAVEGDTYNGKKLLFRRGIEVGQVFKLGSKYAKKLDAKFLDENGKEQVCTMGCYGIGVNRIVASAIETGYDENGIVWPISMAPFEVIITPVGKDDEIAKAAEKIYDELNEAGVECLWDDRNLRGGVKFKDADLLGIPVRITIGKKSMADGNVEVKLRSESDSIKVSVKDAAVKVRQIVKLLKEKMAG